MNDGFILLHRKIIKEWEWYSNINDTRVFIHCLLSANWKDGWYENTLIPRGSFVTGRKKLSKEVGLSEQQVRTSLEHLKSTNNLTIDTSHNFTIITIQNYDKYQDNQPSYQPIDNQLITNNQPIDNHYINNNNKGNKEKNNIKEKYGQFENVLLTNDEYQKLKERFPDYEEKIENLSGYIASKGNKYKSHYATILNWSRKDDKQEHLPNWFNQNFKKEEKGLKELNEILEEFNGNVN